MGTQTKIQASIGHNTFATNITIRGHNLIGDELPENGGKDGGPTPTEFILSGLATCTAATLRMYADRKGWHVEQIFLELDLVKEQTPQGLTTHISRSIRIEGDVDEDQKKRMMEIAEKCPVHRLLTNNIKIESVLIS